MMRGEKSRPRIDREAVRALLMEKLSNVTIAARLGCSPNSITAIKHDLGFAKARRKPSSEWKARGRPRVKNPTFPGATGPTKYRTERTHLARQIAEWPSGIHFEDATVPHEPLFRGTPPAFGMSLVGNSSAMCAAKLGFI